MIETISLRMAQWIKRANPEETVSVDIMKYALMILLNGSAIAFLAMMIGTLTGKFTETVITMTAFVSLRFVSGGRHLGNSDSCVFWSTLAMASLPHLPVLPWMMWGMTGFSLLVVLLFVPMNMHSQVRFPDRYFPMLKIISLMLVCASIFIGSEDVVKAFLLQSLFLIPLKGGDSNEKPSS